MNRRAKILRESEVTHLKGSGPGGQNRNKRMTGVRIVHLPTGLIGFATERRSQQQNFDMAVTRLEKKVEALYHVPKTRRPTKATKGSEERRLTKKRQRSSVKRDRQTKDWD